MRTRELREALESQPLPILRAIAASHGLESGGRREELIEVLDLHLARPETIARLLAGLDAGERALLDRLVAEGGCLPAHRVQRDPGGGELRQLGAGALERLRPWESPISPTERLWYLGLIYLTFAEVGDFRGQVFFIPDEILALLPPVEKTPVPFEVEGPEVGPPAAVRAADLTIVEDAFAALSEIQRFTTEAVDGRFLPLTALQRLNRRLLLPEPGNWQHERETQRLGLLLHLLRALNLFTVGRDGHVRLVYPRVRRWLQAPRDRRLLSLQRAWRQDLVWNELWRVPELRIELTGWRNDARRARERVLHWLAQVPVGEWVTISSFIRAIKSVDPDFQRPDGDYDSWYIKQAKTGEFLRGWENWERVEGALISYLLRGPLAWLAVVDLGYHSSTEARAFAFRLTPWGARFLGQPASLPAPPTRAAMQITGEGIVEVPPGADDWERLHLERLTVPLDEPTGPTTRYALDKDRLIALIMDGTDPERIVRFLRAATDGALPETVEAQLRAWATGWGRITLRRCLLLETDDPGLLRDLQRQPHLRRFFERQLNNRTVTLDDEQLEALIEALRRAGYLPRLENLDDENERDRSA